MTQRAGIAEICFRGQLAEAGVSVPQDAVAELDRTIASNPALYAGELYAAALAQQHPLDLAMTLRRPVVNLASHFPSRPARGEAE